MEFDNLFLFLLVGILVILVIFLIFSIVYRKFTLKTVQDKKDFSIWLTIFGLIFVIAFCSLFIPNNNSQKEENFTIESYKVKLNVNDNNVVDVTEIITANFNESSHGIIKFIPKWLEYTSKSGKTMSRYSKVENLMAQNEEYKISTILNDKVKIQIGASDELLNLGLHTYTISYQYNMGEDPYEGYDEFIFHAFGDYWNTEIKNASIEVTMPNEDFNSIKFFEDKYRLNDISSYINYYVIGNTLYARVNSNYNLLKALTIDIELPDGYFKNASSVYGVSSLFMCVLIIIFGIIAFIIWYKNNKKEDNFSITNTNLLNKFDSAEIGYIYKNDVGPKLVISLIIELASKGYIKIEENKEKKTITVVNLCDNLKTNEMSKNQKIIYNHLFRNSSTNIITEDKEFYKVSDSLYKNLRNTLDDKITSSSSYNSLIIIIILFLLGSLYLTFAYFTIKDLNLKYSIFYLLALISLVVMLILIIFTKRKTSYGKMLNKKIKELRNNLLTLEKEITEKYVNEDPDYFYSTLPYVYVFGISKKWLEKFENIAVPSSKTISYDYNDFTLFDSLSSSTSSSSGGCSSCGGGCSSW